MSTFNTRKLLAGIALLGLMLTAVLGVGAYAADPDPANDADGVTVRITPNADYGVTIDTQVAGVAGGVIDLGALLAWYHDRARPLPA